MTSPSEKIAALRKRIGKNLDSYISSKEFKAVADKALIDFVKRVKRGFLPDLSPIPGLSEDYQELRKQYKSDLGKLAKINKSNATATGQMLDAMISRITTAGFILEVRNSTRNKELGGRASKLTNAEVASFYAQNRDIFGFSDPELNRIIRNIRKDITDAVKKAALT